MEQMPQPIGQHSEDDLISEEELDNKMWLETYQQKQSKMLDEWQNINAGKNDLNHTLQMLKQRLVYQIDSAVEENTAAELARMLAIETPTSTDIGAQQLSNDNFGAKEGPPEFEAEAPMLLNEELK